MNLQLATHTEAEVVNNRVLEYPVDITGIAPEHMARFKVIHDSVHAMNDMKHIHDAVLWLTDEDFIGYHLYKMGTYGDIFMRARENHEDKTCWSTDRIIATTSNMVKVSGAAYERKSYPDIFVRDEIKGRLHNNNRKHDILDMTNAEVLQMFVNNELNMLLHGSPKKSKQGIVRTAERFIFEYRARVATLQTAGLFDKILDEVRPQDEWIHQFVWPV